MSPFTARAYASFVATLIALSGCSRVPGPTERMRLPLGGPNRTGEFGIEAGHTNEKMFWLPEAPANTGLIVSFQGHDLGDDELVVEVNGVRAYEVPADAPDAPLGFHEFYVPTRSLKPGLNELKFDNLLNPPGVNEWSVRNLQVAPFRLSAPTPDALRAEAKLNLERGTVVFARHPHTADHWFHSWRSFQRADYLFVELNDPAMAQFAQLAARGRKDASAAVDKKCLQLLSEARTAYDAKDFHAARLVLSDYILEFFPEKDAHVCPQLAEEASVALNL